MTELEIENSCLDWLSARRIFAFKVKSTATFDPVRRRFRSISPRYRRGCPDIVCVLGGLFVGLEIKQAKGRLSDHQKEFHKDLLAAGGEVHVIRSIEELEYAINGRNSETQSHAP